MGNRISAIVNTLNEEKNIDKALKSLDWVDEIIVCDMYSEDKTVEIAKAYKAKVVFHRKTNYVEPARNFAISESSGDWILILDADEEISTSLAVNLKKISQQQEYDVVQIPRKNLVFGKWIKSAMWWPDMHPRFFKNGSVVWKHEIHSKPEIKGLVKELEATEAGAIIHHHYTSISQFIDRMNRYTTIQANELKGANYRFNWKDLIRKPMGEFLSRYFANKGYEDGIHGLALSLLQSLSFVVVYLKVWELEKFEEKTIDLKQVREESKILGKQLRFWFKQALLSKNLVIRSIQKIKNKFI